MDKLEETWNSPDLNLHKDKSVQVFVDASSATQGHEDMICNAVREISLHLKNKVEKQKEQFVEEQHNAIVKRENQKRATWN